MKNEMNEKKLNAAVELSDEGAEKVSGGGWWNSNTSYASGDTPKFKVGQTVYSNANWHYQDYYYRGIVKTVSDTADGGMINSEFTYTVDWDGKFICGHGLNDLGHWETYSEHETNVYESYLTSMLGSRVVG